MDYKELEKRTLARMGIDPNKRTDDSYKSLLESIYLAAVQASVQTLIEYDRMKAEETHHS